MRRATLRFGFVGATVLLSMLLVGRSGTAQTRMDIHIAVSPVDTGAQPLYAQELGLFKKAGLDVTITSLFNSGATVSGVAAGTFDIAEATVLGLAVAHAKGLPFVIIAPAAIYSTKAPTSLCAVAKNSPIKTAKDLNGKTIGVSDLLGLGQVAAHAWLEKNGADTSSVKFVEIPFSSLAPALVAGRIDAGVLVDPNLQVALNAGQARVLAKCYDAIAPEFLNAAFFTTSDYAKSHPDVIRRFVTVMAETARWANAHQPESAQILEKWTRIPATPGMVRAVYSDRLRAAQVQPVIDALVQAKEIGAPFRATDLFAPGAGGP